MASKLIERTAGVFRTWWSHRWSFVISLGVTVVALAIYFTTFIGERSTPLFDFIARLELNTLDTRFRYRGRMHPDPRIVIVDIDQRSQEVLGRWPFPRIHFAHLLDHLREDGARVVAFDITFSKPDEATLPLAALKEKLEQQRKAGQAPSAELIAEVDRLEKQFDYDQLFAESIQRFGKVVLGNFFLYTQADLQGVTNQTLDRYANLLEYFPFPQVRATSPPTGKQDYLRLIQNFEDLDLVPRGAEANTEVLTAALSSDQAGTGFFNVPPDADGVVRRALTTLPYGRDPKRAEWDFFASVDVQAIRLYLNLKNDETVLNFGPAGVASLEFGKNLVVHPDDLGRVMINYQGPVRTYPYVSMADAANGNFKPGTFKDKIVLVGASATGIGDLRVTPFGGLDYPGVEIHANVIDEILNQNFLHRGARQVEVDLLLIFLFGIPLGIWLALVQPKWLIFGLLLLVPYGWIEYRAFLDGWWLNFITPSLFTLIPNVGMVALYRVLIEEKEKRKVRGAFQQYLSPEVIRRLLQNPDLVKPRKTGVTVMFSDVRGFTSISEQLDAQELADLLNGYLTEMTRVIFTHHGTLDKYIGDAVMAIWGAPFEEPGHADSACQAALEMMTKLAELQQQWRAKGQPVLEIGIGINTGVASVGNMGSQLRYGYTAMGDSVNLASRLEGLNKEYATHIIVSESTYTAAQEKGLVFRELDLIRVKGKLQPVTIYELMGIKDGNAELVERAQLSGEALRLYKQRDWGGARAAFEKLLGRWPGDGPAKVFLARAEEYLAEEPPADWDGVYVMKHK